MGAVEDRLTLTVTEVKNILGLGDDRDQLLDLLIPAGKQIADAYLNNPFEDADGNELAIPEAIKLGLVFWLEGELDRRPQGAIYVKTGDLAIRYSDGTEFNENTTRHWDPFRFEPRKATASTVNWTLGAP